MLHLQFGEAVSLIYRHFGALLIGLETMPQTGVMKTQDSHTYRSASEQVSFNLMPDPTRSMSTYTGALRGYIVAPSKELCDTIEAWNPSDGSPLLSPRWGVQATEGVLGALQKTFSYKAGATVSP